MADLHLHVRHIYFNQYKEGDKPEEYREYNDHWIRQLVGREYDNLFYYAAYPKKEETSKIAVMPYKGYVIKTITHPHFGNTPTKVFAIKLTVDAHST